jgi:23S rRNA (adenine2503-C2)-methyltransferase
MYTSFDPRDHPPNQFVDLARGLGVSDMAARRLLSTVFQRSEHNPLAWRQIDQIPGRLVDAIGPMPRLSIDCVATSPSDGFQKIRFLTHDRLALETVLIPLHKAGAVSLCLSSQVGCAMGCAYCATATMANRRNLATWEIVDQWIQARDIARSQGRRVTGVVFMGMAEPYLN